MHLATVRMRAAYGEKFPKHLTLEPLFQRLFNRTLGVYEHPLKLRDLGVEKERENLEILNKRDTDAP